MQASIIILAGFSAAGKSTLAEYLSEHHGLHWVNHHRIIHTLAQSKGYERARHWLAATTPEVFMQESIAAAAQEMGAHPEGSVFDVIYNHRAYMDLEAALPQARMFLIYVDVPREMRFKRLMKRMSERDSNIVEKELRFRDTFLADAGVEELKTLSGLITDSPDGVVSNTAERIWQFCNT